MGALVLLSGGQDSATCLHWALAHHDRVEAWTVNYGQRHRDRELHSARMIAADAGVPLYQATVDLGGSMGSALTGPGELTPGSSDKLPSSFVPGRNVWMAAMAAGAAHSAGLQCLVLGTNVVDFSGYPDCRPETLQSLQLTLRLGLDYPPLLVQTPLAFMGKAAIVRLARELGPAAWAAVGDSWTCYEGGAYPCHQCPACLIRARGFREAGFSDPALLEEGSL